MRPLIPHFAAAAFLAVFAGCASSPSSVTPSTMAVIAGEERPAPAIPMGEPRTIARILAEGKNRNQVMQHLTHLTQEIGPRLTGSTNLEVANNWAADQFRAWGLTNVHLAKWADIPVRFDRGPSSGKLVVREEPRGEPKPESTPVWKSVRDMEFTTLAWGAGTSGPARGPVVRMPEDDEQFEKIKDKLKGAWVLVPPPPTARQGLRAVGGGMNERALVRYAIQTGKSLKDLGVRENELPQLESMIPEQKRLIDAGILGFISSSRDERVWTTSFRPWRELDPNQLPKDVEVSVRLSDYDYMNSRITDGEPFEAEFDLKNIFTPGPIPTYNTVADIVGTEKPDEYIIVSGHLDSWNGPGSQGATDNGTGSSVTLEAARLLMAAGAKPKRTIRFILWTGEEQGLLGSREWVKQNEDLLPKISAVFVDDGGTNFEGGLKCTDAMVEMLAAATAPVNNQFIDSADGKPMTVNIQGNGDKFPRTGGSDHASFVAKGVPGFFWDEVGRAEYGYGWHTQHDKLDLAIPEYLQQSSTCAAITAYNLACAQDMLPRFEFDPDAPSERRPGSPADRRNAPR